MRWHGVLKQPPKCSLPWMLTWNNINQRAEITSGRQSSWGGLLWLHSWVFGHSHTGAVVVTAGQPCRHVAGRQRVILRELTLSQRVVAAKFLEEYEKKNKKHNVWSAGEGWWEKKPHGAVWQPSCGNISELRNFSLNYDSVLMRELSLTPEMKTFF